MKTRHRVHFESAGGLSRLADGSIELAVTSPPYPMIEMWDGAFSGQDGRIVAALGREDGWAAFRLMHELLDPVWKELYRVLADGGIACIDIGDATRTIGGRFALYPNHARILTRAVECGFAPLPAIIWRKQTNAPNKFMGSGMLPAGAYVTLEHEFILVLRKGDRRRFPAGEEGAVRRESAFFWEERNEWFSDVWADLKGARQDLEERSARKRSAAFPFELAYRLISMFSARGDTVLDPFLGTGTTLLAAMAAARNSIGFEIDAGLEPVIAAQAAGIVPLANSRIRGRLDAHAGFIRGKFDPERPFAHRNRHYGFPVITRQETELLLSELISVRRPAAGEFEAAHEEAPSYRPPGDWSAYFAPADPAAPSSAACRPGNSTPARFEQAELF